MSTIYDIGSKALDGLHVEDEDLVVFDVLEWFHEGWEFGHPTMMLRPIIRIHHDNGADALIESVCINLACGWCENYLDDGDKREIEWRGWNMTTLRRRFNEALRGKKFPVANYKAYRISARFYLDKGEMTWKTDTCPQCGGSGKVDSGEPGIGKVYCLECCMTGRVPI